MRQCPNIWSDVEARRSVKVQETQKSEQEKEWRRDPSKANTVKRFQRKLSKIAKAPYSYEGNEEARDSEERGDTVASFTENDVFEPFGKRTPYCLA